VKIGPVDHEIALLNLKKKKEINASKIDSPSGKFAERAKKCYQRRLIPLAFVAVVLENKLQYHGLAVHIDHGDDGATSSKNLVNFCLVTPEMTGLICVPYVFVSGANRPNTCIHRAAIQKCHGILLC